MCAIGSSGGWPIAACGRSSMLNPGRDRRCGTSASAWRAGRRSAPCASDRACRPIRWRSSAARETRRRSTRAPRARGRCRAAPSPPECGSAASRVHGTTSSTHSGRAETTSIGGGSRRASASRTVSSSAGGSTGLCTYLNACSRTALSSVSGVSSDVITTTRGRVLRVRSLASRSSPFMRGIQTSSSSRSKRRVRERLERLDAVLRHRRREAGARSARCAAHAASSGRRRRRGSCS